MPRNNKLGSTTQPTPMPRDFEGSDTDFSVTRIVDGHAVFPDTEDRGDGVDSWTRQNAHHPELDD